MCLASGVLSAPFAERVSLPGLIQVLQEKLLVRLILELLNQLFDFSSDLSPADYRCGFPHDFPTRLGGLRIFLLLDQADPVVHFANLAEVTLETDKLCGIAPA